MQDPLYRDIILEHWQNPQNYGVIENADIDIEEKNPYCGDHIHLTIKLEKNKTKIEEIKFEGESCAISKASSSIFTEELKNKTLEDIKKTDPQEVLDLLGIPLTPTRAKCALLIFNTLQKSLKQNQT